MVDFHSRHHTARRNAAQLFSRCDADFHAHPVARVVSQTRGEYFAAITVLDVVCHDVARTGRAAHRRRTAATLRGVLRTLRSDLIADNTTGDHASHGGSPASIAFANLIAEQAADHRADHRRHRTSTAAGVGTRPGADRYLLLPAFLLRRGRGVRGCGLLVVNRIHAQNG